MADEKKPAPVGPLVAGLRDQAPQIMAELMRSFIEARDLNSRARVRMQMKAMLDLFSTDTDYPPVPALNEEQRMAREGIGAMLPRRGPAYGAYAPVQGLPLPQGVREVVVPGGGAEALRGEIAEALEEPGVIPAPGAAVADPAEQ